MKELIYEPIRKIIQEDKPNWNFSFDGDLMNITTKDAKVDNDTLEKMQNSGFKIYEIQHHNNKGIFFSIIEKSLDPNNGED